jgi:hypothetical protein
MPRSKKWIEVDLLIEDAFDELWKVELRQFFRSKRSLCGVVNRSNLPQVQFSGQKVWLDTPSVEIGALR